MQNQPCRNVIKVFSVFMINSIADDLDDYLEQLQCFKTSTTIRQFMESIEQAQQSHSICTIKLCLVGGWLDKTMDDLEKKTALAGQYVDRSS